MEQVRELLHLGYRHYPPHPALRPWVQGYWSMEGLGAANAAPERVYPDGGSSLIFNLSDGDKGAVSFSAHQVLGTVRPFDATFGIRFTPTGAHQLLSLPMSELAGGSFYCGDADVPGVEAVYERLLATDALRRVPVVDAWLLGLYSQSTAKPGVVEHVITELATNNAPVNEILANSGVSPRSVERLFKRSAGVSPRQLKAWQRVKKARYLIKLHPEWPLTEVGLLCGYYDQAHFINQFKRVTTFTPGGYRKRQIKRLLAREMAIG